MHSPFPPPRRYNTATCGQSLCGLAPQTGLPAPPSVSPVYPQTLLWPMYYLRGTRRFYLFTPGCARSRRNHPRTSPTPPPPLRLGRCRSMSSVSGSVCYLKGQDTHISGIFFENERRILEISSDPPPRRPARPLHSRPCSSSCLVTSKWRRLRT